jgi:hypothetical protein
VQKLFLGPPRHVLLALLQAALHREHVLHALADQLAPTVPHQAVEDLERDSEVALVALTLLEEEAAAMQREPLFEVELYHAVGEVGLRLDDVQVGDGSGCGRSHCYLYLLVVALKVFGWFVVGFLGGEKCCM